MVFTNANPFAGFELAEHLRDCITPYLEGTTSGLPARVCITTGEIAWDDCECGQLAISLTSQYETASFPDPWSGSDNKGMRKCGPPMFVFEYTISMTRCSPTGDEESPPTCAELAAAARVTVEDAWAVRAGLLCCLCAGTTPGPGGVKTFDRYTLGPQVEVGPGGMCQGSVITVSIGVMNGGYPCGVS